MKITNDSMQYLADILSAQIVERYAIERNVSNTEAARSFIGTKTYQLLYNPDSFLALESAEYITDMLDAEEKGDYERWLEI